MWNRIISLLKACCPFIIMAIIIIMFFLKIECATYGDYTFRIQSGGSELKIISGTDHVGDTIEIKDDNVRIDDNQYSYSVTEKKGKSYNIDFTMPDGGYFTFNQSNPSNVSFVNFHNSFEDVGHGGNSSELNTDNRELLISAVFVHLSVLELYSKMTSYFIVYTIFVMTGYYFYFKPQLIYNLYNKIFKRKKRTLNIVKIKVAIILIMILSLLTIFLLI